MKRTVGQCRVGHKIRFYDGRLEYTCECPGRADFDTEDDEIEAAKNIPWWGHPSLRGEEEE